MTQFSQGLIDQMKEMYAEEAGETISDYEANEALNNLCGFFKLLHQWDQEDKARQQAEEAEMPVSE